MKNISFVILCVIMVSCKNKDDEPVSQFKKCDFPETVKTLDLKNEQGILNFSNSIEGIPVNEYTYYIKYKGQLPMVICNMPEDIKIEKDTKVSVTFSGKMQVLDDRIDAISTLIELTVLKL